jgi:hypothetical protein
MVFSERCSRQGDPPQIWVAPEEYSEGTRATKPIKRDALGNRVTDLAGQGKRAEQVDAPVGGLVLDTRRAKLSQLNSRLMKAAEDSRLSGTRSDTCPHNDL